MRNETGAAFVLVMVIISGAMGAVAWNGGSLSSAYTGSTTTTTLTIPCPTLNSTQTSQNGPARPPDYGPLLGNFSAISVVESVYGTNGNFSILVSLMVLNRSFTNSRPVYFVNVTMKQVSSNVTMISSNGYTTTTVTTSGTQTQLGSFLGLVSSNGSMISVSRPNPSRSVTSQLLTVPLEFFRPLISLNTTTSPSGELHLVNRTVVAIGTNRMAVTNYAGPTLVIVESFGGCGSEPSSTSTVAILSNEMFQAGRVPGTDFTLVTRFSEGFTLRSNSSLPTNAFESAIVYRVSSFRVG